MAFRFACLEKRSSGLVIKGETLGGEISLFSFTHSVSFFFLCMFFTVSTFAFWVCRNIDFMHILFNVFIMSCLVFSYCIFFYIQFPLLLSRFTTTTLCVSFNVFIMSCLNFLNVYLPNVKCN
jgi:hypothetical protein